MAEECSSGGFSGLVGLLRVVIAHKCLRALTFAFGDHESQVGGGRSVPGHPTKYLPAALLT